MVLQRRVREWGVGFPHAHTRTPGIGPGLTMPWCPCKQNPPNFPCGYGFVSLYLPGARHVSADTKSDRAFFLGGEGA